MDDEFQKKWEQGQIENWKSDEGKISLFFKRFNVDIKHVYKYVMGINYEKMQTICYLLSKIDKAIKICDFLDALEKNNHEDVDIIKIYILISHAEITSRNFGERGEKIALVKKYFEPVESKLKYKIKPSFGIDGQVPDMNFADVLYKIRCEYTHEGSYTGRIFKRVVDDANGSLFSFKANGKILYGQCGISYKEFLEIYMKALFENIKIFSRYTQ
ncbi:MAG: hypothetical protein AAB482_00540 [Patescibacteria group bacterium]